MLSFFNNKLKLTNAKLSKDNNARAQICVNIKVIDVYDQATKSVWWMTWH